MWGYAEADEQTRTAMRGQILAFLDEYCRDLSLRDVGQWYDDAFRDTLTGTGDIARAS